MHPAGRFALIQQPYALINADPGEARRSYFPSREDNSTRESAAAAGAQERRTCDISNEISARLSTAKCLRAEGLSVSLPPTGLCELANEILQCWARLYNVNSFQKHRVLCTTHTR